TNSSNPSSIASHHKNPIFSFYLFNPHIFKKIPSSKPSHISTISALSLLFNHPLFTSKSHQQLNISSSLSPIKTNTITPSHSLITLFSKPPIHFILFYTTIPSTISFKNPSKII
ncbi:hypothetical protein, partial [Bacillus pumilus]|uniref:hypothetical protein n=1 Tax=Bacillus pumilus TaxID=1408 RepID=UPI001C92DCA1